MKILVVEDAKEVVEAVEICCTIRWPDAEVISTDQGLLMHDLVESETPDIVILDLGLPDIDSLDVLPRLRKTTDVPVIILTARAEDSSRVKGLELGGDDYVVKPFSPAELLVCMNAVLCLSAAAGLSGKIISNNELAEAVWGLSYIEDSAIRMRARRSRIKLKDDPRAPRLLHSHRGLGYSFDLAS